MFYYMKKAAFYILLIIAVVIFAITTSLFLTDYKKIYNRFLASAKITPDSVGSTGYEVIIFPFPHVVIDQISQKGKIDLSNIELHLSFASVLKFSPRISVIKIGQANLHLKHDSISLIRHDEFIGELIKRENPDLTTNITKLVFVESDGDIALEIKNFTFEKQNNLSKFSGITDAAYTLSGSFKEVNENEINKTDFDLSIEGDDIHLLLNEKYENAILQSGNAEISSLNLPDKINRIFPDISSLLKNYNSEEETKFTFNILPDSTKLILSDIVIESPSVQGKGVIELNKNQSEFSNINLDFAKIDLNSWRKTDNVAKSKPNLRVNYSQKNKLNFTTNKLDAKITAANIKLNDNNSLANLELSCLTSGGKLVIKEFSGTIDQNGTFQISGAISQNAFRSIFEGNIYLRHADLGGLAEFIIGKEARTEAKIPYALSSDIKMSSVDISMQNLLLKTPSTTLNGSISTKFIGNSPRTNANLHFDKINLNNKDFPALSQIYSYIHSLAENMKNEDYLNKFIALRKINSWDQYNISFDKLTIDDNTYDKINFNLNMTPGHIRIDDLYISDGKDYIDSSIDIIASGLKPVISITVHDGSKEVNFLTPSTMLSTKTAILDKYALDKITLNLDLTLSKIYQGDIVLTNVVLKATNDKTLFNISKFETDLLKGRLSSAGSILLEPYTINLVYALNSASVEAISTLLPEGLMRSPGIISASGMISTSGNKIDELLYNLYTRSNVITKDIIISNFSIDNLIAKISAEGYEIEDFQNDLKNSLLTGETTVSDLKAELELSKGIIKMPSITFKTEYVAGTASASANIYDFSLNLNSILSFYLAKPTKGRAYTDYSSSKMAITASGSIFTPKKEADTKDLLNLLEQRERSKK